MRAAGAAFGPGYGDPHVVKLLAGWPGGSISVPSAEPGA
jgi:hypothetical protein